MNEEQRKAKEWMKKQFEGISKSAIFVGIDSKNYRDDIRCAAQLGLAVMLDKPIFLLIDDSIASSSKLLKICDGWEPYTAGDTESTKLATERLFTQIKEKGGVKNEGQ